MNYSVQLYNVRSAVEQDLPGTVRRLAEIGYSRIEPYNFAARADEFASAFADNRIAAPTGHAPLLSQDQDEIFAAAKRLGIGTVIEPYLPAEYWQDAETIQATAAKLNAAAKKGSEYGIRVGYHNHQWEVESTVEGQTALEYFEGLLDPELVLEVDTYWAAVGGQDPVALLKRLGARVVAIHIKDGPVNLDLLAQLPAGQGQMDIWGAINAVPSLEVGVVEFDDYAGDMFEAMEASLRYLEAGEGA
jgi:sugar phosphate isomerase/epimerase